MKIGHATRIITVLLANFQNDMKALQVRVVPVTCPKYANWGHCRLLTNIGLTAGAHAIESIP